MLYATLGGQQGEKFADNAAGIDVSVCYRFPLAVKSRTAFSRLPRSVFACYLHSRLFPTLSACLFTFLFLFIIICSVTSFARSFIHSFRFVIVSHDKEESEKGRLFLKLNSFDESLVLEDCTWLRRCNTCIALVIQVASKFGQFPLVEINVPRVAIRASLLNN